MANKATSKERKENRLVFRSVDEIIRHFQPDRAEKDRAASKPFAGLERVLTPEQFQRVRAELANARK